MSELQGKLMESQNEAAATKEELNSCRESLEKFQELLQVQRHSGSDHSCFCAFAVLYNSSVFRNIWKVFTYLYCIQLHFLKEREMTIAHLKAELFQVSDFNLH